MAKAKQIAKGTGPKSTRPKNLANCAQDAADLCAELASNLATGGTITRRSQQVGTWQTYKKLLTDVAKQLRRALPADYQRPSVYMRPTIQMDGNQWCVLYGENLQDGVAGFGDTPALAMTDFDKNWEKEKAGQWKQ